jgi:outer membrane protein OmpA-like peptidoglycan-associated protein
MQSGISKHTPLIVTGYTCEKGSNQYNQHLSMERALSISRLLRTHGFTVATVQGKGAQNPLTHIPQEFYRNRRVEISIVH